MSSLPNNHSNPCISILLSAMAGGLAWGIRGQYGHETGAMIAGVLVGLVLVLCFCPKIASLRAARAVALMALGVSFGGSMTYGQTVGLTHDAPLIGNTAALQWGLLGLFIKGGIWIGFAGLFLGIGLSQKRYGAWEGVSLLCVAVLLWIGGTRLLNQPFDPESRLLPSLYFSDHWKWEPDHLDLKPRRETWGGLLLALAGLLVYVTAIKRDRLARQLTLWGILAGGLGFAGGQCFQAAHAWHPTFFDEGFLAPITRHFNWWNLMETSFGFIFGGLLAFGVWRNRQHLCQNATTPEASIPLVLEITLLIIHVAALITWNFASVDALDALADVALTMGILPILGILGGRLWPYLFALLVVAIPIAGKTLLNLAIQTETIPLLAGISIYVAMPLYLVGSTAIYFSRTPHARSLAFSAWSLVLMVWVFFYLNLAFFHYPWPWEPWTGRTPHGLAFALFTVCLTVAALTKRQKWRHLEAPSESLPWKAS